MFPAAGSIYLAPFVDNALHAEYGALPFVFGRRIVTRYDVHVLLRFRLLEDG
jgi:hypothetical protein